MMSIARVLSFRATCRKLAVGAVLINDRFQIIGTGYNGVPRNYPHCSQYPCEGADQPAGSDTCIAVHAEQNALMQCHRVEDIFCLYCTHAPCMRCTKMLLNTSCSCIVFGCETPMDNRAAELWKAMGRAWNQLLE